MDKNIALVKEALELFVALFIDLEERVKTIEKLLDIKAPAFHYDPAPKEGKENGRT